MELKENIEKYIKNGRLVLSRREKFDHYYFVLVIIAIPAVILGTKVSTLKVFSLTDLIICIVTLIVSAFYILYQNNSLKFREIKIDDNKLEFLNVINATRVELDWMEKFVQYSDEHLILIALKREEDQWAGYRITIIYHNGILYENIIFEPHQKQVFLYGGERKYKNVFYKNLLKDARGEDVLKIALEKREKINRIIEKEEFELEHGKEWTFKKTLTRITLYLLMTIISVLCIMGLIESFNFLFLLIPSICFFYVILDVYIIIKNTEERLKIILKGIRR